jgi:hypothetical protein
MKLFFYKIHFTERINFFFFNIKNYKKNFNYYFYIIQIEKNEKIFRQI